MPKLILFTVCQVFLEFATKCFSFNLGLKVSTGIILNLHNITKY